MNSLRRYSSLKNLENCLYSPKKILIRRRRRDVSSAEADENIDYFYAFDVKLFSELIKVLQPKHHQTEKCLKHCLTVHLKKYEFRWHLEICILQWCDQVWCDHDAPWSPLLSGDQWCVGGETGLATLIATDQLVLGFSSWC